MLATTARAPLLSRALLPCVLLPCVLLPRTNFGPVGMAQQTNPQDTQAALMKEYQAAVNAHRQNALDEALARYRAVLDIHEAIPAVHNNIAAILLAQGSPSEAETAWRRAVELKPEYAEAHYNLAVLLSERAGDGEAELILSEAERHCSTALEHRADYVQAHHLMGNILVSKGKPEAATKSYALAEALASSLGATNAASAAATDATLPPFLDGVRIGHVQQLQLEDGSTRAATTLAMEPLILHIESLLTNDECDELISLAAPRLKASLTMGNATAVTRTSSSVFLPASESLLLETLQRRLAAMAQLPLTLVQRSEDLQVVHYDAGSTFGMHHDSSSFQPRLLTAFYYLNDVEGGGETSFPAADGALSPAAAMALSDPTASGVAVAPRRGNAILFYNHMPNGAIHPAALHAGCKVLRGEKWGANHWVRLRDVPDAAEKAD